MLRVMTIERVVQELGAPLPGPNDLRTIRIDARHISIRDWVVPSLVFRH